MRQPVVYQDAGRNVDRAPDPVAFRSGIGLRSSWPLERLPYCAEAPVESAGRYSAAPR